MPPPGSAAVVGVARSTALGVGAAYSALPTDQARGGRSGRELSRTRHLRAFQNWVKAVLISTYAPRPTTRVLDLACGRLGDLAKWRLAGARDVCAVDIAAESLRDACARVAGDRGANAGLRLRLVRADLGATDLMGAGVLAPNEKFDAISCQMAIHYFFQTERRALTFFRNIADRLNPGGVFLGTTTDSNVLVKRVRDGAAAASALAGSTDVSFGNSLFRVRFDAPAVGAQWSLGNAPYGCRYNFWLAESVEDAAAASAEHADKSVDGGGAASASTAASAPALASSAASSSSAAAAGIDEYLVPWQLLERLARAAGLEPVARDNFHEFFQKHSSTPSAHSLLSKMSVLDTDGTLGNDEWEVAGLYRVFVFRAPLVAPSDAGAAASALPPMADLVADTPRLSVPADKAPLASKLFPSPADIVDLIGEE